MAKERMSSFAAHLQALVASVSAVRLSRHNVSPAYLPLPSCHLSITVLLFATVLVALALSLMAPFPTLSGL
jgi:hypothetical protein